MPVNTGETRATFAKEPAKSNPGKPHGRRDGYAALIVEKLTRR
jgi:hypothetical protein